MLRQAVYTVCTVRTHRVTPLLRFFLGFPQHATAFCWDLADHRGSCVELTIGHGIRGDQRSSTMYWRHDGQNRIPEDRERVRYNLAASVSKVLRKAMYLDPCKYSLVLQCDRRRDRGCSLYASQWPAIVLGALVRSTGSPKSMSTNRCPRSVQWWGRTPMNDVQHVAAHAMRLNFGSHAQRPAASGNRVPSEGLARVPVISL
ncbi:hypothetical protein C8Q70DRAFT_379534 [Cubamyces menziesii]|nr:hypothetical protein C8Q70DRAFT_379534 [Cubamyces menziesii]